MASLTRSDSGISAAEIADMLSRVAGSILLIGKRGTGKDRVAQLIHEQQHRQQFEKIDCSQHEDILRRALFGYFNPLAAEVAFGEPDVEAYESGSLDRADEGTIYLDRIDLAPQGSVALLLDVLEGKPYSPVGSSRIQPQGDIQFIASCEPHPFADVPHAYLCPKLQAIFGNRVIGLPSVRDRRKDIPDLLRMFASELMPGTDLEFSIDFIRALEQLDWPGNLWDLRWIVSQLTVQLPGGGRVGRELEQQILGRFSKRPAEPSEYARRARCVVLASGLVYRDQPVSGDALYSWIDQFSPHRSASSRDPRDLAEELVRWIHARYFYSNSRLRAIVKQLFGELVREVQADQSGQPLAQGTTSLAKRTLRDRLVISNPLGLMKSPEAIHLMFRSVSGATPRRNAVEFGDLPRRIEQGDDLVVVFLDDFMGTGEQFENEILGKGILLNDALRQAVKSKAKVSFFMLVCVAYEDGVSRALRALKKAPKWLRMKLLVGEVLGAESKTFDPASVVFTQNAVRTEAQEIVVQKVGAILQPDAADGRGGLQSLVVFEHQTPNGTLPVIWKSGLVHEQHWRALFPRMAAG